MGSAIVSEVQRLAVQPVSQKDAAELIAAALAIKDPPLDEHYRGQLQEISAQLPPPRGGTSGTGG